MRGIPLKSWLLVALSAALQILCFPVAGPIPVWRTHLCWIAFVPLLLALTSTGGVGQKLSLQPIVGLAYGCGVLWYLGSCYWIYQTMYFYGGLPKPVALLILLLFAMYLGLYHALFGLLFGICLQCAWRRQGALLLSPFLWVAVELARARVTSFPWDLLGVAQVDHPVLTRLAPFTGVYGMSFFIVAVNMLFLLRMRARDRRYVRPLLTAAGLTCVAAMALLLVALRSPGRIQTRNDATLVQENLSVGTGIADNQETQEQMLRSFSQLSLAPPPDRCFGIPGLSSTHCIHFTGDLPSSHTDLIVWPEAPAGFHTNDLNFSGALSALAREARAPLVIGSLGIVDDPAVPHGVRVYDSAALVTADGESAGRYDKIHLVPFGEYVPFRQLLSFAERLTAGVGDMDRGTERTVFRTNGHALGVFVCYESIFGDEVRQFVKNGAEVLVNISDDGWYGDTSAAWQHLNMVRMRAIENRRWILRSTNTGITAAIDPFGRVTASAPRHLRTALHVGFNYEQGTTFYTKHGDLFAYGCVAATLLALGYATVRRKQVN